MHEKPQKRLVSKGRYAWVMTGRVTLLSAATVFLLMGAFLLILSEWMSYHGLGMWYAYKIIATIILLSAFGLFKKERAVERVVPINKRIADLLPPEESLVRASVMPPSQQQAELLRATGQGPETSSEELLRAGQVRR